MVANARVMMVGDGINDARALASAIGMAMGSSADGALETADAAMPRNHVAENIRLARAHWGISGRM